MKHDEMISVIQADQDGRAIQYCDRIGIGLEDARLRWRDVNPAPSWNFAIYAYRIKPESPKPREWWVAPPPTGGFIFCNETPVEGWIHVREVLPEGEQ